MLQRVFLLSNLWLKQYHFPESSLLKKTFEWDVIWQQFVILKKCSNSEQSARHFQVFFMFLIVYPQMRIVSNVDYILFITQYYNYHAVQVPYLWGYRWDDEPVFNVLGLCSMWHITIVIIFFTEVNVTTPRISKVKVLVITLKGIWFIYWTDLMKYLQMPINASNIKKFPF